MRCAHDNIAAVSVPKQRSSPAPKAKRRPIFDAMATFAVQ
jgi:ribosomal protein L32